ncbi:MAG: cytochrome c [Myxococcota bacterium]
MRGGVRTGELALLLLLPLLAGACGDAAPPSGAPPQVEQLPEEPAPSEGPPEAPAPEPAPASVPAGDLRGDAANGQALYGLYCATCHGQAGKGDGPASQVLDPRPRDHTAAAYMGSLSDEYIYQVIRDGGASVGKSPLMAAWGAVVPEPGLRDLVAYVRSLSGT